MERICIPDYEYKDRVKRCAAILRREGLDALIVNGNEADYANPRYFSGFWPLFERCGVVISAAGDAALLVGPESREFGADRNKLDRVFCLKAYREGANPTYPELKADSFQDVFRALGITGQHLRIGIASFLDTSVTIYQAILEAFPGAQFRDSGDIMTELRSIKSDHELACLQEGYRLADLATQQVIAEIRPGMTELQMVGVAQRVIYENGAEYEGLPMYVFSEASTRHAISRSSYRRFQKGDIVQLNLSAKIDGYSASIGYPICLGKLEGQRREIVQFCRRAHQWTVEQVKAGVMAGDIAKGFYKYYVDHGFAENFVYGPLHSTGMIEVEAPWAETISMYPLRPNMTYQADTFISCPTFGVRWEKGIVVTEDGCRVLSPELPEFCPELNL
ncbi:MAG TPA: aminopeptidase P family protein [Candidatus Avoscillospira avicola]|uniref:Aminopeptidase P family protein n=1 Tax=Candidatus Avoscillospira avicola TaxID=2840706 RepID=A0A9D1IWD6_9FIRM|nr:aminopeptidase P family protein [Candidatus Avoscillospira avicola]